MHIPVLHLHSFFYGESRSCVLISFVLPAFYRNRLGWSNAGGERCYFFGEFHVIKHRYHWPQGNYSPCICSLPCEGADRLSDGSFAGHAFSKGCRDSGLCGSAIFPNDFRGISSYPFIPAISGDWGRRGSHAYPSSFYSGIYPVSYTHLKSNAFAKFKNCGNTADVFFNQSLCL